MNTMTLAPTAHLGTWRAHGFSVSRIVLAFRVMAERQRLARMDDRQLADLGLAPEDAMREAARPIWDLPAGR